MPKHYGKKGVKMSGNGHHQCKKTYSSKVGSSAKTYKGLTGKMQSSVKK